MIFFQHDFIRFNALKLESIFDVEIDIRMFHRFVRCDLIFDVQSIQSYDESSSNRIEINHEI